MMVYSYHLFPSLPAVKLKGLGWAVLGWDPRKHSDPKKHVKTWGARVVFGRGSWGGVLLLNIRFHSTLLGLSPLWCLCRLNRVFIRPLLFVSVSVPGTGSAHGPTGGTALWRWAGVGGRYACSCSNGIGLNSQATHITLKQPTRGWSRDLMCLSPFQSLKVQDCLSHMPLSLAVFCRSLQYDWENHLFYHGERLFQIECSLELVANQVVSSLG